MTDRYALAEKKVWDLHQEIVKDIVAVLNEKGYKAGMTAFANWGETKFEIMNDRLIIDNFHTDNLGIDALMPYLRRAHHVIPR